jgi:hypothetical protein
VRSDIGATCFWWCREREEQVGMSSLVNKKSEEC